ncbi:MAG: hypothetical protein OMM_04640 [Candidatus Magnetoglobus multicellularis str. Araruama]|uniref:Uncharacterized protein n=1 Tax=Candidatus Magnetoglobus multicellularis str. Araruama TaxID=890399 RepID=A0A1V1P0B6_9BACT|nr:MAG: hypothetical protein OMM_04640 [Candidatus Magnetoglobus multicellularis str. Araruama]
MKKKREQNPTDTELNRKINKINDLVREIKHLHPVPDFDFFKLDTPPKLTKAFINHAGPEKDRGGAFLKYAYPNITKLADSFDFLYQENNPSQTIRFLSALVPPQEERDLGRYSYAVLLPKDFTNLSDNINPEEFLAALKQAGYLADDGLIIRDFNIDMPQVDKPQVALLPAKFIPYYDRLSEIVRRPLLVLAAHGRSNIMHFRKKKKH